MPLFVKDNKAVLYVHVPKTGGSSIEHFFLANGFRAEFLDNTPHHSFNRWRRCSPQHMVAEQILQVLRTTRIDHMIMTVRDPMARALSEYRMRARGVADMPSLDAWLRQSFRRFPDEPDMFDNHIRPQSDFWIPGCEVMRQEDGFGEPFVTGVEKRLGMRIEQRAIGNYNRTEDAAITQAELEAAHPMIAQFYRQDYIRFGY